MFGPARMLGLCFRSLSRKAANKVFYRLGEERLISIIGFLREIYCP